MTATRRGADDAADAGEVADAGDAPPTVGWGGDRQRPLIRTDLGERIATRIEGPADMRPVDRVARVVTFLAVLGASAWVFKTLHPDLLFADTTPAGGDMGAHVWGPMYLMRHVLPHGQLSGWTPDWYAGFPAFQFYMVVPSLFIVALTAGIRSLWAVPLAAAWLAVAVSGYVVVPLERFRRVLLAVGLVLLVLTVPIPYNISFKLVTISGLVSLPICCWAFGRLASLRFPTPALLAVGSLLFIYNLEPKLNSGTGTIIGGNMGSTMAGEFAFSISLSLCMLYLGVLIRGLRTGRHRALTAALLALTGLCHLIPVFFALLATVVILLVHLADDAVSAVADRGRGLGWSARVRWLIPVMVVAGLLPAFWVIPFVTRHAYVNDMGWEKLPYQGQTVWDYLRPDSMRTFLVVAAVGLVISVVRRLRVGIALGVSFLLIGVAFSHMPQARLWNARVLPFYYLCMFLLAAIAVGELLRLASMVVSRSADRPSPLAGIVAAPLALAVAVVFTGLPLDGQLPGAERIAAEDDVARWPRALPGLQYTTTERNLVSGWAEWNYLGYERKPAYAEYHDIVATMDRLGRDEDHGCGRAFWEYGHDRLNPYGTPMALMLLPYWTDSCIGSMEGLFFESAATTPFHFLMQSELSESPSSAQRDLPYPGFNLDQGIQHLQMMGVKYYMAFSPTAVAAADADDRLTQVASSGPWRVYEVADSELVVGLENSPVVLDDVGDTHHDWLGPAVDWFTDPSRWDVMVAGGGPDEWFRADVIETPVEQTENAGVPVRPQVGTEVELPEVSPRSLPPVAVSDIESGDNRISFTVDRPGVPVLVKASYFPNWQASGAEGPFRVAPNLMVVVPTDEEVTLHYGRTPVEWGGYALTALGLVGLVVLARLRPVAMLPTARFGPLPLWNRDRPPSPSADVRASFGAGDPHDDDRGSAVEPGEPEPPVPPRPSPRSDEDAPPSAPPAPPAAPPAP